MKNYSLLSGITEGRSQASRLGFDVVFNDDELSLVALAREVESQEIGRGDKMAADSRMTEHLATNSSLSLQEFCEGLRTRLSLPLFHYDSEDDDPYAWVDLPHMRINVSHPTKPETLQEWMPNTPSGSTFQIILIICKSAPSEWIADCSKEALLAQIIRTIEDLTGCAVTHYSTR